MAAVIGVVNEKGGVGKSTVCFNVAWELAQQGRKVLMIDLDGQRANLSYIAGIDKPESLTTMYNVLVNGENIKKSVLVVEENLHIIPATHNTTEITMQNCPLEAMAAALQTVKPYYDLIFIDVSPSPNRTHALTLAAADYVLVPMNPDITSVEANKGIVETIKAAQEAVNPSLKVLGIVFNKYTWRPLLSRQVVAEADRMAKGIGSKLLKAKIRNNVSISEAVGSHQGITTYAPKSNGAEDITALCAEIEREVKKHG